MVIIDQEWRGPGANQMAMMLLLQSPQAEVLGITMVTAMRGARGAQHTLRMLELIHRTDVPVVPGGDLSAQFARAGVEDCTTVIRRLRLVWRVGRCLARDQPGVVPRSICDPRWWRVSQR